MEQNENPFIAHNDYRNNETVVIPRFPKTNRISFLLSEEACAQLDKLVAKYISNIEKRGRGYGLLLEQIGLFALHIGRTEYKLDEESGVDTDQLRQSGYEDGLNGNPTLFLQMFNQLLADEFQEAYMRGYMEGAFLRSRNIKPPLGEV